MRVKATPRIGTSRGSMIVPLVRSLSLIALLMLSYSPTFANLDCGPEVRVADTQHNDTKEASALLRNYLRSYQLDDGVDALNRKKIDALKIHEHANQRLVIDAALHDYCILLSRSSVADKDAAMGVAKRTLRTRTTEPCVFTTEQRSSIRSRRCRPLTIKVQAPDRSASRLVFATRRYNEEGAFRPYRMAAAAADLPAFPSEGDSTRQSDELDAGDTQSGYLFDAPYVVNDANKHFVQVSSVHACTGPEDAIDEALRLKKLVPSFDFTVFNPVPGNDCQYAIMAATWATREIQSEVLRKIQAVIPKAIAWSCRREGEHCF